MAYDKVVDSAVLDGYFEDIGDSIRVKNGSQDTYTPAQMPAAIEAIPAGGADILPAALANASSPAAEVEYENTDIVTISNPMFSGNKLSIEGSYQHWLKTLSLPNATTLCDGCFSKHDGLESVSIPKVSRIPSQCFLYCSALEDVEPYSGTDTVEIGSDALCACTSLETFKQNNVTIVANGGLSSCSSLKVVDLGDPSKNMGGAIGQYVFYQDSALVALVLRKNGKYTLDNTNAFGGTPIANGNGYIYVPRAKISLYEQETNWTTFAGQFRAIEDYTDDGTLTGDFVLPAN